MVTPEELEALDLMCWLRNGDDAARLAYCNQSTISRRSQQALKVFNQLPSQGQRCHGRAKHPAADGTGSAPAVSLYHCLT